jgi:hypothetical protein
MVSGGREPAGFLKKVFYPAGSVGGGGGFVIIKS